MTEPDRYPDKFTLALSLLVSDVERKAPQPPPWETHPSTAFKPHFAFSTAIELEETKEKFGKFS